MLIDVHCPLKNKQKSKQTGTGYKKIAEMVSSLNFLHHSFDLCITYMQSNVTLNKTSQFRYFMCSSSSTPGAANEALD